MDRLAHAVVAAEGEGEVRDAARDVHAGTALLDQRRGVDEVLRVVGVLLDAGRDGENVRIEDDVLGREADLVDEELVGAFADLDLALGRVGLAVFVEGHHDDAGPEATHDPAFARKSSSPSLSEIELTTALPWTQRARPRARSTSSCRS